MMGSVANGLMKDTKEALFNAPLADQKLGFIMATAKKAVLVYVARFAHFEVAT